MARPRKCRNIGFQPCCSRFSPDNQNPDCNTEIMITLDELEAIRLADLEQLYQEVAAEKMEVSRQTFGLIIQSAHKKIADALINGRQLIFENVELQKAQPVSCSKLQNKSNCCEQCRRCHTFSDESRNLYKSDEKKQS